MPRRIGEGPESRIPAAAVVQRRGTQREHLLLRRIDVLDVDVEMELLRILRIRPPGRPVAQHLLEGEPDALRQGEPHPRRVAVIQLPAEKPLVEGAQRTRVRTVDNGSLQLGNHAGTLRPAAAANAPAPRTGDAAAWAACLNSPAPRPRPAPA
jgi:hypothetical protein